MELALLTRCLSIELNHGTNGSPLEIFKLQDLTMPPSLLNLSSCPACLHQVEVLTDIMMIVTHLILTVDHQCNKIYISKSLILLINIRLYPPIIIFSTALLRLVIIIIIITHHHHVLSVTGS